MTTSPRRRSDHALACEHLKLAVEHIEQLRLIAAEMRLGAL
jgi:hypothetical protein